MRTIKDILKIAEELNQITWSAEPEKWHELYDKLKEDKIFTCEDCGKKVSYADLESWQCGFEEGQEHFVCSRCYENYMGEDL